MKRAYVRVGCSNAVATGLGTYICDLPTENLANGTFVVFTFHWPQQDKWAGTNYRVDVGDGRLMTAK
jgi:hypothetical protein